MLSKIKEKFFQNRFLKAKEWYFWGYFSDFELNHKMFGMFKFKEYSHYCTRICDFWLELFPDTRNSVMILGFSWNSVTLFFFNKEKNM